MADFDIEAAQEMAAMYVGYGGPLGAFRAAEQWRKQVQVLGEVNDDLRQRLGEWRDLAVKLTSENEALSAECHTLVNERNEALQAAYKAADEAEDLRRARDAALTVIVQLIEWGRKAERIADEAIEALYATKRWRLRFHPYGFWLGLKARTWDGREWNGLD